MRSFEREKGRERGREGGRTRQEAHVYRVLAEAGKQGGFTLFLFHPPFFPPSFFLPALLYSASAGVCARWAWFDFMRMCTSGSTCSQRIMAAREERLGNKGHGGHKTLYGYFTATYVISTSGKPASKSDDTCAPI